MAGRPRKIHSHSNLAPIDNDWVTKNIDEAFSDYKNRIPLVPEVLLPFRDYSPQTSTQAATESEAKKEKHKGQDSSTDQSVRQSTNTEGVDGESTTASRDSDNTTGGVSNSDKKPTEPELFEVRNPIFFWSDVKINTLIAVLYKSSIRLTPQDRTFLCTVHQHALEVQSFLDFVWPITSRSSWDDVTKVYNAPVLKNVAIALASSYQPATDLPFAAVLEAVGRANMSARKNPDSLPYTAQAIMAFFGPMHGVVLKDSVNFNTWREIIQYATGVEAGSLRRYSNEDRSTLELSLQIYQDILADIQRQLR